jgi:tetratricopeptide (TPR) repeat protein
MFRKLLLLLSVIVIQSCSDIYIDAPEPAEKILPLTPLVPLGNIPATADRPTIAHVNIVDLDQNSVPDILVCDVSGHQISWIQSGVEKTILGDISGAVHAEAVDIDGDEDLDVLVAAMGVILPSTAHTGKVIILENDGEEHFTPHIIAENIQRVTDVQAGDMDGDGDLDLSVAQFGYTHGQVQWFENIGDWKFTPHQLIERSGAIHAPIVDIDNDGDLDIVALLSQEWETVVAFVNNGQGEFMPEILHDVADADFSSSGITVVDLDKDGDQDILWTNGDAFVSVDYRPLPTHGLQWLENIGNRDFVYHRIGKMDGAYGPAAIDMDGDGDLDIVTVSEFAFWERPDTPSIVWWEQGDAMSFTKHTIAKSPTHLVTCDVGDMNSDGKPDIVVGGMALYPPFDRITRVALWQNEGDWATSIENDLPEQIQTALNNISNSGKRGMFLHANGFSPRSEYVEAMENDPTNARWPYYLGMLDVAIGDSDSALQYFLQASLLDDSYAPLQTRLGELYIGRDEHEIAKDFLQRANTEYARVALAQLASSQEQWQKVIDILDGATIEAAKALQQTANAKLHDGQSQTFAVVDMGYQMDDPWLFEVESMCILAQHLVTQAQIDIIAGRIDAAQQKLLQAVAIDPTDRDARLALAEILLRSDRYSRATVTQAIVHLEAGLQIDPKYVMTRTKYGWALYLAERFNEASQVWLSILQDEPKHGPALANLAQLAFNAKQYQNAFDFYKRAFEVPADSPFALSDNTTFQAETLYRYALAAIQLGKKQEAITLLEKAVVFMPNNMSVQFEVGNLYLGAKQFEKAVQHIEIANALEPNKPRVLAALGYAWFQLGEAANARGFLEQSVQLSPKFALAWYHLGNTQVALGDKNSAIESFKVAIQLQPTFKQAKEALYKVQGR